MALLFSSSFHLLRSGTCNDLKCFIQKMLGKKKKEATGMKHVQS